MKKVLSILLSLLMVGTLNAAITVQGIVTEADTGEPIIGATVQEQGTTNGTITDFDGHYELTVQDKAHLVFSYVGMTTQTLAVKSGVLNVKMSADAIAMEEVVVTAMGVTQEKKRLNFAVQTMNSDNLTAGQNSNFVNALQGKVAGVQVTNGSGSPNAGTQVIIRGISSINPSQNNEPMIVMDGVPINGGTADINPNDIENVTILKGAAASALYGQDAANGVIMITTKQGEAGKIQVRANASWQWDTPANLLPMQTMYAPGSNGFYRAKTSGGWGPMLNEGQPIYDNLRNFLGTGFYHKYDFSVTGGTEKMTAYASVNWSNADGMVPNDYKQRFGAMLKTSFTPAKWVTMNFSVNTMLSKSRSTGGSMSSVYGWPITDDIMDYKRDDGYPRYLYLSENTKYGSPRSPLYSIMEDDGVSKRLRNIITGSVTFTPVKGFNITGRLNYDTSASMSDSYTVPRWDDSYLVPVVKEVPEPAEGATAAEIAAYEAYMDYYNYRYGGAYYNDYLLTTDDYKDMDKSYFGSYSSSSGRSQMFTASVIATYKLELPKDWSMDFMLGGELKMSDGFSMSNYGENFIIPGVYSLSNTDPTLLKLGDRTTTHSMKRTFGYYGEIRADYKGLASLSVTGRADWSSTINHNPFFYPSVTAGLLFSELFDWQNNWFSYGKIRGNYAVVGKDAPSQLYDRRFKQFATYPDNGYGIDPTMSSADRNLKPEMSYSWEVGIDLRFFDSRTRLDVAYYNTKVDNQIVTVRVSPAAGHILQTRNEGAIRNHGFEATIEQDVIKKKNIKWTLGLNMGLNRGKVVSLPENVSEITNGQYGDIFPSAALGGSTTALTGKDYLRTEDGTIICDENGFPQIDPRKNLIIANREPIIAGGLTSTLDVYGVTFGLLFDGRVGGDIANVTGRSMLSNGKAKMLEQYRGRQVVVKGVVKQEDGSYEPNTTPITLDGQTMINYFYNVSSNFIEDGTYLRLSYVTLGYDFAKLMPRQKFFKALKLNFTANNLFLLTKYTGTDVMCNASTGSGGTGAAGIDNYPVPSTRSYNISLNATF